jgi:anaerobic selenocysteine-containing dehydrogenase
VRGLPETNGELPVAVLAEEMLTPGPGQVKALVTLAGNPVLSTPNGTQLERALGGLEFMVALDQAINETTRFADVILPSTTALERDHYDLVFNVLATRNVARYSPPTLPRPEGALHDWEILDRLAAALAEKLGQTPKAVPAPRAMLDAGLRAGPFGASSEHGLTLQKLEANPHGLDLGPLAPSFPERLLTEGKRIVCAPPRLLAALAEAQAGLLAEPAGDQLLLIGRRHLRSNNSWMHNCERLVRGRDRSALQAHPEDLARLGLQPGGVAKVTSRTGEARIAVEATEDLMPGVVSIPHGWGHHRPGTYARIAAEHAGISANDLTDEGALDAVSGNAALNGIAVKLQPAASSENPARES